MYGKNEFFLPNPQNYEMTKYVYNVTIAPRDDHFGIFETYEMAREALKNFASRVLFTMNIKYDQIAYTYNDKIFTKLPKTMDGAIGDTIWIEIMYKNNEKWKSSNIQICIEKIPLNIDFYGRY